MRQQTNAEIRKDFWKHLYFDKIYSIVALSQLILRFVKALVIPCDLSEIFQATVP